MTNATPPYRILFVCVENSNRSQMAEAFARLHGGDLVEVWSAGSRPSGRVNPKAITSMKECGVDLSAHRSKSLDEIPDYNWDWVITMGCGDACPFVRARNREDWALPDPRDLPADQFNQVRDDIERRVIALIQQLKSAKKEA
ncbi:MAG: arsenate reductase ArsC [Candidatus Sumerlaeaceae bacterium]|jgi:protein-tyrosine-phosphatase